MNILGSIIGYFNPNKPSTSAAPNYYTTNTTNTTNTLNAQLAQQQKQARINTALHQLGVPYGYVGGGGQNMSKGIGGYSQGTAPAYQIDETVYKLRHYAELCGDTLQMVELKEDAPCDDVKIIMLKASEEGKVVKEVGIKISNTRFAVYREKGEVYV